MAIHHLTPPVRGGERPRLSSAQRGPVTIALAAMHAADPERQRIRDLRRQIAERIERDTAPEWLGHGLHVFSHGGRFA